MPKLHPCDGEVAGHPHIERNNDIVLGVDHQPRSTVATQRDFDSCNFWQVDRGIAGHREGACSRAVCNHQATVGERIATKGQNAGIDRHVEPDQLAVRDHEAFGAIPAELNICLSKKRGVHACHATHRESPGRIAYPPDGFR